MPGAEALCDMKSPEALEESLEARRVLRALGWRGAKLMGNSEISGFLQPVWEAQKMFRLWLKMIHFG